MDETGIIEVAKFTRSSSWSKLTRSPPSMLFYSQTNLTCTRVSHINPEPSHFFKTKRDRSDFSLDWFVPYWLRSAKSWFHTVLNLSSQLFLRLNARNIAKNQQLAIFPRKCLALPCCSISPPSFHRKLKLAFGCWKSVCCSFRLLKVRLLISVLKRIVSVNEFLPLSLKVKVSKRYNELKRF